MLRDVGHDLLQEHLIHAENDHSTAAGLALAEELERLHKPHSLKIYPLSGYTE
jgi:hypothetical protein